MNNYSKFILSFLTTLVLCMGGYLTEVHGQIDSLQRKQADSAATSSEHAFGIGIDENINRAEDYMHQGKLDSAELLVNLLGDKLLTPDDPRLYKLLNIKGHYLINTGDLDKAVEVLNFAIDDLKIYLPTEVKLKSILSRTLGYAYLKVRKADSAISCLQSVLEIDSMDDKFKCKILKDLSYAYHLDGRWIESLVYAKRALSLYQANADTSDVNLGRYYQEVGSGYSRIGDTFKSEFYLLKAQEEILKSFPKCHEAYGLIKGRLLAHYYSIGDLDKSIQFAEEAYEIMLCNYKETGNLDHLENALINLSIAYEDAGELSIARNLSEEHLILVAENYGILNAKRIDAHAYLAYLQWNNMEYEEALINTKCALDIAVKFYPANHQRIFALKSDYAHILMLQGNSSRSKEMFLELQELISPSGQFYHIPWDLKISVFSHLAEIFLADADLSNCSSVLDSWENLYQNHDYPHKDRSYVEMICLKSKLLHQKNQSESALRLLEDFFLEKGGIIRNSVLIADEIEPFSNSFLFFDEYLFQLQNAVARERRSIESFDLFYSSFNNYLIRHLRQVGSSRSIQDIGQDLKGLYSRGAHAYLLSGSKEGLLRSLELSEEYRNILFKIVQNHKYFGSLETGAEWYEEYDSISKVIDSIVGSPVYNESSTKLNLGEFEQLEIAKLYKAKKDLYQRLSDSALVIDNLLFEFKSDILHDLVSKRENNFLYYQRMNENYVVFYKNRDNVLSYNSLNAVQVNNMCIELSKIEMGSNSRMDSILQGCFNFLIPKDFGIVENILIVPDEVLGQVSFGGLKNSVSSYLESLTSIQYSNSFFLSQSDKRTTHNYKRDLTYYSPVYSNKWGISNHSNEFLNDSIYLTQQPFLRKLGNILSRYKNNVIYEGTTLSKSSFLESLTSSKVLHINAHAFIDKGNPYYTKIFFNGHHMIEGILYAKDVLLQHIPASLTVLAACSSGLGNYLPGEGFMSLAYSFMYAGSSSILMTLWKTDEKATAEILEYFYENLSRGLRKSEALRQAKLEYIDNCQYEELKDPYYWAGLVIYGDDSPVKLRKKRKTELYIIGGLALLALFITIRLHRRTRMTLAA